MPLPDPAPRQLLHKRTSCNAGATSARTALWDIEGRLVDTKTYPFPNEDRGGAIQPGEPLHDLWIRLTIDSRLSASRRSKLAPMERRSPSARRSPAATKS
jgi:hypothetical protein